MGANPLATDEAPPAGARCAAWFFALCGLLDFALALGELPRPLGFWPLWQAVGNGLLYLLLAAGLRRRFAFCRSLAMVYCLTVLVLYAVVLAMALGHAPLAYPRSVFVSSLFQAPSAALLLPYLRSTEAALFFRRPLL